MSMYDLPNFNFFKKNKEGAEDKPKSGVEEQKPSGMQDIEAGVPVIDINQSSLPPYPPQKKTEEKEPVVSKAEPLPVQPQEPKIAPEKNPSEPRQDRLSAIGVMAVVGILFGLIGGLLGGYYFYTRVKQDMGSGSGAVQQSAAPAYQDSREERVVSLVKDNSPSVVSITITKDVPVYQYQNDPFGSFFDNPFGSLYGSQPQIKGYQKQEVGEGSGFIVSEDGLVLTNKHVVDQTNAQYTVVMSDKKEYPAKVLATDPVQDLAILKIEGTGFKTVTLGDSDSLQVGQTAIAIGNALGEFPNTVSVGIISGLSRSIVASGGAQASESLENVIQTDAAINAGNSGGPLLNLSGEVIGINTAVASQAQGVGFALPINLAKRDIEQVKKTGKISYPFLGVQYTLITPEFAEQKKLSVDYGALIGASSSSSKPAVISGSAAQKAGVKAGDIILEFGGEKITSDNSLAKIIAKYLPGDKVTLKILRNEKELSVEATLGEYQ
ncbi:MAG: trypsin-like peptidase domain-containing protein [Candidatus Paceibacterota bacterium]